jgi:hypothetical protein
VPSYRATLPRLARELARMRRYERPLVVVVFRAGEAYAEAAAKNGGRGNGGSLRRNGRSGHPYSEGSSLAFWHAGAMLRDLVRDTDVVSCDFGSHQYVVVLPETNRQQAHQAAVRLQNLIRKVVQVPLRAGVAEFPSDGLIIEELVKGAAADCEKLGGVGGLVAH